MTRKRSPAGAILLFVALGLGACAGSSAQPKAPEPANPWSKASVAELRTAMSQGHTNAQALCAATLRDVGRLEPELNPIIALNPKALDQARERDQAKGSPGLLHGIPVIVKDNIETKDPIPTTAGSLALAKHQTNRDAPVIANLRAEGAVILAKANLSEWANFRSTHSTSGWSGVGGLTKNPYDHSRSACGSSAGSAVAVAAGLVPAAIGTETDGSIVCPAGVTGIVGFKPTVGLLKGEGIVPISYRQDTAGAMARTVHGAATVLAAMIGQDAEGPQAKVRSEILEAIAKPGKLEGRRIGVVRSMAGYLPQVDALLDQAVADLRASGVEVIDGLEIQFPPEMAKYGDVLAYEFRRDLADYLASSPGKPAVKTIEDLIEFNRKHPDTELTYFGQDRFESAAKLELTEAEYTKLVDKLRSALGAKGLRGLLDQHKLDAVIAPTGSPAWTIDLVLGDHFLGSSSTPSAVNGWPILSVPMGRVAGLPVGLSFLAGPYSEALLVELGRGFEARTRAKAKTQPGS